MYLGSGEFIKRNESPEIPIKKSQYIAGCLSSDLVKIPLKNNIADSKSKIKAIKFDFVAFAQYQIHEIELILSSGTRPKASTATTGAKAGYTYGLQSGGRIKRKIKKVKSKYAKGGGVRTSKYVL